MSQTSVLSMTQADPATRSAVYKLLSLAFKYPFPELFEAYQTGDFLSELLDTMSMLPHLKSLAQVQAGLADTVRRELTGITFQDFKSQYTKTFDVGDPQPPCPPYEGVYRAGIERTGILIEVSGFYKHFGLKMNPEEGKRDLPDNISAELEFLHFLTFKENQASEEGNQDLLKGYVLAQKDFLERHMVNWIPKFSDAMQRAANAANPLFGRFAEITSAVALAEFDLVRSMLEDLGYDSDAEVKNNGKKDTV